MTRRDAVLVVNPVAGRGASRRHRAEIVRTLEEHPGVERLTVVEPASAEECIDHLRDAATSPSRTIVAGGDGMVHLAVQAFAGTGRAFGIIPVGTGNDFVDAVGLPRDIASAVDAALAAPGTIDAMEVSAPDGTSGWSRWAATVVTFGFAASVNERAERMSFPRGSSRYTVATLLELGRMSATPVRIVVDGAETAIDATMVAIANTSTFGGGMKIAPTADHGDGRLEVVVIGAVPRRTLLRVLPKAFSGGHVDHPAVTVWSGRVVEVTGGDQRVRADGEALCRVPFVTTARRSALRVAGVTSGR